MIIFIEGALGSGKSMECMARIVEELQFSNRFITTNMPLKLDEMHRLLVGKFGEDFNLYERIRILTNEECFKFWLHPAVNYEISSKPEDMVLVSPEGAEGNKPVLRPNYESLHPSKGFPGAFILIDECPEYFDAESWKGVAPDCKHFLRHSRKLEMDVVFVAQDRGQIAKPLRIFAQKTIVMRNLGYERIGIFRAPDKIYWQEFFKSPDHSSKPQASGVRSIDKKWLGAMYDTSAGVGLGGGRRADTQRRKKGLHPGFLILLVFLVCAALWSIPHLLGWSVRFLMPNTKPNPSKSVQAQTNNAPPRDVRTQSPAQTSRRAASPSVSDDKEDEVTMAGFWFDGMLWHVFLSDGREYKSDDAALEHLTRESVRINGKVYRRALVAHTSKSHASFVPPVARELPVQGIVGQSQVQPSDPSLVGRPVNIHYRDGSVTHHTMTAVASD